MLEGEQDPGEHPAREYAPEAIEYLSSLIGEKESE